MPTQDSTVKFYRTRQSAGVWTAMMVLVGVISIGPSFGFHSFWLTFLLFSGEIAVWYIGYGILSKNLYFVSSTRAGFRGFYRGCAVEFDQVRPATISMGTDCRHLVFDCDGDTVRIPLDPLDEGWLSEVKAELSKRGITVTTTAFGFPTVS